MDSEILDRSPPHDLDAEKAVLGAIILDRNVLDGMGLSETDFHVQRHAILFGHLAAIPGDQPIDAVSLRSWLTAAGDLDAVGGAAYLAELSQSCPVVMHVSYYARLVREAAQKRQLIHRLSDGLRHLYNGQDLPALVAGLVAGIESLATGGFERFTRLTCPELDAARLSIHYLVRRAVVAGQPGIIAGPKKSLKTSIIIDLGLSLATGTPFLGELAVPRPARVGIMSGESGMATIQETARRVAIAKGYNLVDVDGLTVSDSLPQLESVADLDALAQWVKADRLEVLILDPTYLMMTGDDAGNLFKQGSLLRPLTELGQKLACTVLLVHHTRKNIGFGDQFAPPELEGIAWSGFQEWARQWILIGRRERYEEGTGEHRLWLACGGSAGHSSLSALTVSEDTPEHIRGRDWRVTMERPSDAYNEAEGRADADRQAAKAERIERDKDKILQVAAKYPLGETKQALRDVAGMSGARFSAALGSALQLGEMCVGEIVKPNRRAPYPSYKLGEGQSPE